MIRVGIISVDLNPTVNLRRTQNKNKSQFPNNQMLWEQAQTDKPPPPTSLSSHGVCVCFNTDMHLKDTEAGKKSTGGKVRLQMSENVSGAPERWVCVYRHLKTDRRTWTEGREARERGDLTANDAKPLFKAFPAAQASLWHIYLLAASLISCQRTLKTCWLFAFMLYRNFSKVDTGRGGHTTESKDLFTLGLVHDVCSL